MTVYAPLRVSRDKQDVRNQKFGIKHYAETLGLEPVQYSEDVVSALVEWRKRGIGEVMKTVEAGDHIIVSEISRLARTTLEVLEIAREALDKKVSIHVVKQNIVIDGSINSQIMVTVLGLVAQIERAFISERTKEALARKKSEGVTLGRPKGSKAKKLKLDDHAKEIEKYLAKGLSKSAICKLVECSRPTLDSWLERQETLT